MSKTAVVATLGISWQTLYDILNERQPISGRKMGGNGGA